MSRKAAMYRVDLLLSKLCRNRLSDSCCVESGSSDVPCALARQMITKSDEQTTTSTSTIPRPDRFIITRSRRLEAVHEIQHVASVVIASRSYIYCAHHVASLAHGIRAPAAGGQSRPTTARRRRRPSVPSATMQARYFYGWNVVGAT